MMTSAIVKTLKTCLYIDVIKMFFLPLFAKSRSKDDDSQKKRGNVL